MSQRQVQQRGRLYPLCFSLLASSPAFCIPPTDLHLMAQFTHSPSDVLLAFPSYSIATFYSSQGFRKKETTTEQPTTPMLHNTGLSPSYPHPHTRSPPPGSFLQHKSNLVPRTPQHTGHSFELTAPRHSHCSTTEPSVSHDRKPSALH